MYKIKIMKNESTPSDEEIRSYMNFDSLLEKRKIAVKKNQLHTFLKWGVPVLVITGIVSWFIITKDKDSTTVVMENTPPVTDSSVAEVLPTIQDTISVSMESEQIQNEKAPVASQRVVRKSDVERKVELPAREDVYIQAEPAEGYEKLYDYFNANLIYPTAALADSIQGIQTISFVVSTDGKPENITVTKSLGTPFEKEARRLIENMPPWKPATLNGKPVPSKVAIPLTFQIEKIKK
jgi:TonB family protein